MVCDLFAEKYLGTEQRRFFC